LPLTEARAQARATRQGMIEQGRGRNDAALGELYASKMVDKLTKSAMRNGAMFVGSLIAQESGLGANFVGRLATTPAMGLATGNWLGATVAASMTIIGEIKNRVQDHEEKLKKIEEDRIRAEVKRQNEATARDAENLRLAEEFREQAAALRRELVEKFDAQIYASAQALSLRGF
jgi:hypothetical protein